MAAALPVSAEETEEALERKDNVHDFEMKREAALLRFRDLALAEEKAQQEEVKSQRFLNKLTFNINYMNSLDRNANFDSAHKRDWTSQINLMTTFQDTWSRWLRYTLRYAMNTGLHQHFERNNTFLQELTTAADIKLHPRLFADTSYAAAYSRFPGSTQSSYWRHRVRLGLKHYPFQTRRFFQRPNYTLEFRDYVYRKARITVNNRSHNTLFDRKDVMHRLEYEVEINPFKTFKINTRHQLGFVDSNDQHLDYYDYDYFRSAHTLSFLYKKIYVFAGFQFQRNNYHARRRIDTAQREDLPSTYGGIFYLLHSHLSIGFNASYFKSDSNFPELEYQGATFTLGIYTNFKAGDLMDRLPFRKAA